MLSDSRISSASQPWPHLLASLGAHSFPVNARTRHPFIDDFYNRATRNHAKLERWPVAACAIITGQDSGVVALDIDRKKDASGKIVTRGPETDAAQLQCWGPP
jgi:hypothetical protein